MLIILVQWRLHKILNHLSQCHLGVQLDLGTYEFLAPTPNSWDDRGPSMTQNELFYLHSLLHRSPLSCFWLLSAAISVSSLIFPFFFCCSLCIRNFHRLRHRNKLVHQVLVTDWIYSFRCKMILVIPIRSSFQSNCRGLVSFDNTSMFCHVFSNTAAGFAAALTYWVLQGVAARIGISNFLRAFLIVSLNSSSLVSMK